MNVSRAVTKFLVPIALVALGGSPSVGQVSRHFFPQRPGAVALHREKGTLVSYGVGNDTGEFSIRGWNGRPVEFYVGYPLKINGRINSCAHPTCRAWPRNVVLGKTPVTVTYWWAAYPGTHLKVRVSDSISTGP